MYPDNPIMDFECSCPCYIRKNVWNDFTGVHMRYCPVCNERRSQDYKPTQMWEETGQGKEGKPIPAHLKKDKNAADKRRG